MTSSLHDDDHKRLGMVVAGSLADGVEVRLDPDTSTEDIKVGTFVTIQGKSCASSAW